MSDIDRVRDIAYVLQAKLDKMDTENTHLKEAIWNLERYIEETEALDEYGEDGEGDMAMPPHSAVSIGRPTLTTG